MVSECVCLCCAVQGQINIPKSMLYFLIYLQQLLLWLRSCTLQEQPIKKKQTAVCRPRMMHASHFLLLWFKEVWIYLIQPSACQYKMYMHYTILSAPRLISSASWLVCVCVRVFTSWPCWLVRMCVSIIHSSVFLAAWTKCPPPTDVKA